MYCGFYGFSEKPFEVTPDPRFLYLSPTHREVLASLVYGVRERRGFIVLVGEVGTGKTTLINAALESFKDDTKVAYIANTSLSFNQMLFQVLQELRLLDSGQRGVTKLEAIRLLNDLTIRQLSRGGNVVLIVDEAQNLDPEFMENLRLLSNLETRRHKLIQIVLAGQPELDTKLSRPDLRQLTQRVSVRRTIAPLTEEETRDYLQHRLTMAHYEGPELFSKKSKKRIYAYSGGIPRKINILCDNALLIGFGLQKRRIDAVCLEEAAEDLRWASPGRSNARPFTMAGDPLAARPGAVRRAALAGAVVLAGFVAFATWMTSGGPNLTSLTATLFSASIRELSSVLGKEPVRSNDPELVPEIVAVPPKENGLSQQDVPVDAANLKERTAPDLSREESPGQLGNLTLRPASEERRAPPATEASSGQTLTPPDRTPPPAYAKGKKIAVVEANESLIKIIRRNYGTYTDELLARILKENPEIRSPDRIFVGQKIALPDLKGDELHEAQKR